MKTVLVVPWGNPFEWANVTYAYEEEDKNIVMENIPCTLPILKDAIKPDEIIIIVLDTLANFVKSGEPPISQRNFSCYEDVKEDVRERIRYFIEEKLGCDFNEIKLVISPGVGVFGNIRVEGEIIDYYHYTIYELAENLPTEDMIVYLDLTHGINFMPTLTYRALMNLLGLASYLREIRFKVLNSEPYPRGIPKEVQKVKLRIRVVEDRDIKPKPILSLLEDEKFNRWNAFISSVANGFPLVFATFYPNINEIRREIENKLGSFYDGISVSDRSVMRRSKLDSDFETLSKLYYLLKVLNTSPMFNNMPKQEITLDELKVISEILFNKIPRIGVIVEEQIKFLKNEIGRKNDHDWRRLSNWQGDRNRVIRNFIAHSGFECGVTMSKKDGSCIEFKCVPERENDVIDYAIESLRFRLREDGQE